MKMIVAELTGGEVALALGAGAVGSLLTIGVAGVARVWGALLELPVHDRRIGEPDEDLARWVSDDHLRLKRELLALRDTLTLATCSTAASTEWNLALPKSEPASLTSLVKARP